MAPKDYQAVCGQAQDRGHLRILRALKEKVKCGRISVKVIAQEFLLCRQPVLEVEAMLAATCLKDLIRAFSDCRLDDLPVSIPIVFDSDTQFVRRFRAALSIRLLLEILLCVISS